MSNETKNTTKNTTEEKAKAASESFMNKTKKFMAEPVKRSDVAIAVATVAVAAAGYYGYQKYQANKELNAESGLQSVA